MNKNLYLFLMLVGLIIATYFLQEKKTQKDYQSSLLEGRVFKEEIIHLKFSNLEAIKKNGQWWSDGKLLSHITFMQLEKKLSSIKKVKKISGDWNVVFTDPFSFEVNNEEITIGQMSLDKKTFYLGYRNDIFLTYIDGESHRLTSNSSEIASVKRDELIFLLSRTKENLREKQVFRHYLDLPLERIVVKAEGQLPYELNFKENLTFPQPMNGISVLPNLADNFFSYLTQISIKQEVPFDHSIGFKKLSQMSFLRGEKKVIWEIWLESKNSADVVLVDRLNKKLFSMNGSTLKPFFLNLQDYWNKKVIPAQDFENFTRLKMTLTQGDKKADVLIMNRDPFEFQTSGFKVINSKMDILLEFIFNLGSKKQGDRVSHLTADEKNNLLSANNLRLKVMGQDLHLWLEMNELIVANLTRDFKVHFNLKDETFSARFEDMLK